MQLLDAAKNDVRMVMAFLLPLLGLAAGWSNPTLLTGLIVSVVTAQAINAVLLRLKNRQIRFSIGALITGLIVGLIVSGPPYAPALAAAFAIASKHLIQRNAHQLFNPAAFGAVVTTLLIPSSQSWWVAGAPLGLIALVGIIVILHFQRIHQTVSYLLATVVISVLYLLATGGIMPTVSSVVALLSGSAIFFSTIMIIEPLSNAHPRNARIVFAVVVAVVGFALGFVVPSVAIAAGLLVANALVPMLNKIK